MNVTDSFCVFGFDIPVVVHVSELDACAVVRVHGVSLGARLEKAATEYRTIEETVIDDRHPLARLLDRLHVIRFIGRVGVRPPVAERLVLRDCLVVMDLQQLRLTERERNLGLREFFLQFPLFLGHKLLFRLGLQG